MAIITQLRHSSGFRHCTQCKEGRVVENKAKKMVFCSFCGHEFRR